MTRVFHTEVFHLNFRIEKFDFRPPKQRQEANKKVQFGYFFVCGKWQ